ncbi:hypothetical protein GTW43_27435 [Streptomyces sp. SID5785]|uniref:hypothetical protein n=1 Tax=Streptomyces sp. SID5785 TaxID=2690309 RepID=UPI001361ED61|nr:hypothetical protein [Streptomyces sp. SID5785]MZD08783.1 hypothetical protein [Streptomyces sp. SID5785]
MACAQLVGRAGQDCGNGLSYLDGNTRIRGSAPGARAWNLAVGDHEERVRQATDVLSRSGMILRGCEKELRRSASWYRTVNRRQARALDAAHAVPGPGRPVTRAAPVGPADFLDVRDASGQLKPAREHGWLRAQAYAPSLVTGRIGGDWLTYLRCAEAWNSLGDLCAAMATNLRHGNEVLGGSWQGNAADTAWTYVERTADRIDAVGRSFHALREQYVSVTEVATRFAAPGEADAARPCGRPAGAGGQGDLLHEVSAALAGTGPALAALCDDLRRFPVLGGDEPRTAEPG